MKIKTGYTFTPFKPVSESLTLEIGRQLGREVMELGMVFGTQDIEMGILVAWESSPEGSWMPVCRVQAMWYDEESGCLRFWWQPTTSGLLPMATWLGPRELTCRTDEATYWLARIAQETIQVTWNPDDEDLWEHVNWWRKQKLHHPILPDSETSPDCLFKNGSPKGYEWTTLASQSYQKRKTC